MLARLFFFLPFHIAVPDGQEFPLYEYVDNGYKVRVYPPGRSDRPAFDDSPDEIKIDGVNAFQADVLHIYFWKEAFDRMKTTLLDPPEDVIMRAVNGFLMRLRYITRAPQIRTLALERNSWNIRYLNDDESDLEVNENLVRGRGTIGFTMRWITLNRKVWDELHSLPADFEPPPWDGLLLDATEQLPSIGPAVVLAATALEVFIADVLNKLAALKSVDPILWKWINDRKNREHEPSVEEEFDSLLQFLAGHSLKENLKLWEAFMNLKSARNTFVHEGVARIGKSVVTSEMSQQLIESARQVISTVRQWLPESIVWPEFKHDINVTATMKLI